MAKVNKTLGRTVENVSKHRRIPHRLVLACGGIVRWKQMGYNEARIMHGLFTTLLPAWSFNLSIYENKVQHKQHYHTPHTY
jgi:hypothetical protein